MARPRVPLEQLLANLQNYHEYLVQDPCANRHAKAYVEARIGCLANTNSRKSVCTDSGEQAGSEIKTWCAGPRVCNGCRLREEK